MKDDDVTRRSAREVGEAEPGDAEWLAIGERLRTLDPEKYREVVGGLREVIEAQEIIARYDSQLLYRGRPRKKYVA